ncbi:hypothetical protein [Paraburkholderia terrae]|nr:hypothetical protein [Paraburkholderia terrae]
MKIATNAYRVIVKSVLFILLSVIGVALTVRILVSVLPDQWTSSRSPVTEYSKLPNDNTLEANKDRNAILLSIDRCLGYPSPGSIRQELREVLGVSEPDLSPPSDLKYIEVHPLYIRIASLNDSVFTKRLLTEVNAKTAYIAAQFSLFSTIIIGLLTTILVALSSSEFGKAETARGRAIRLGALVLPAIGTAVAATIAFYDPSGNLARQNQMAAALEQLNTQIALGTWQMDCVKNLSADLSKEKAMVDSWSQRFQEITAGATQAKTPLDVSQRAGLR